MERDKKHNNKTYQDLLPKDKRDRYKDWCRRLEWSQTHKPTKSADWLKYRD